MPFRAEAKVVLTARRESLLNTVREEQKVVKKI
jgi:hypothetical protein